ncbi:MAG: hypothetical protein LBR33_10470 [Propionibacteriaceae bacterium]|nr:hypothetical protein [Propionibacteriaceae bacterium]
MSTSRDWSRWSFVVRHLAVAAGLGAFSAVYEHFSHGVYTHWMTGLAAGWLVGAVLPYLVWCLVPRLRWPGPTVRLLHVLGLATFAVGAALKGVMVIYGTTADLVWPYFAAGAALLLAALVTHLAGARAPQ